MALVVVVLVVALVVGRLAGGSFGRLATLPVAGWPLVLAAALAQAAGSATAGWTGSAGAYVAGAVSATLLVSAFLVRNRKLPGVPLVALGLLSNALVVGLNGAMPVSLRAAARAGVPTGSIGSITNGLDPRHTVAGAGTTLGWLGDRFAVPLPVLPQVVSAGDVLIAAGLGLLLVMGMTTGGRYDGSAPDASTRREPADRVPGAPPAASGPADDTMVTHRAVRGWQATSRTRSG